MNFVEKALQTKYTVSKTEKIINMNKFNDLTSATNSSYVDGLKNNSITTTDLYDLSAWWLENSR